MLTLHARPLKGDSFNVQVGPAATVLDLKAAIAAQQPCFPAERLKLVHAGRILSDEKAISHYGIKTRDLVVVMLNKSATSATPALNAAAPGPTATPAAAVPIGQTASLAAPTVAAAELATAPAGPVSAAPAGPNVASAVPATEPGVRTVPPAVPSERGSAPVTRQGESEAVATPVADGSDSGSAVTYGVSASAFVSGSAMEATVQRICQMGFPRPDVERCLRVAFNNPDRAVEYLMNGIPDDLHASTAASRRPAGAAAALPARAASVGRAVSATAPTAFPAPAATAAPPAALDVHMGGPYPRATAPPMTAATAPATAPAAARPAPAPGVCRAAAYPKATIAPAATSTAPMPAANATPPARMLGARATSANPATARARAASAAAQAVPQVTAAAMAVGASDTGWDAEQVAALGELQGNPLFEQLVRVIAGDPRTLVKMLPALAEVSPGLQRAIERDPETFTRMLQGAAAGNAGAQQVCEVSVFRSQKGASEQMKQISVLALGKGGGQNREGPSVFVCPDSEVSKPWLGFGGSFTEASAVTLKKMSPARQKEVMEAYFHSEKGICYTLGRVPIGSCDFGVKSWTCGNLAEGDMELKGFSLAPYEKAILPMIHHAVSQVGSPLQLLASPWSPPPWMKTSQRFGGDGKLRPECRAAWALHFVRFIQEMRRAGIPIWAVSVQNEPQAASSWESCIYSAEEERDFVRDHLGPALERAGLGSVNIVIHDHNRSDMLERAAIAYSDAEAAKYIWGVGYHWYGDARFEEWVKRHWVPFEDRTVSGSPIFELRAQVNFENVRRVAELRPDKHVIFTEGCQELGHRPLSSVIGDWKLGERYAMNIIADVNSGCEGWIDWNLCLDETGGPNHQNNCCVAPILCDTVDDKVLYQPSYWYLGHFARHIRPGARRISCSSSRDALEVTAFKNLDGAVAVVVMNQSEQSIDFWLKVAGRGAALADAPRRSITTFVVSNS